MSNSRDFDTPLPQCLYLEVTNRCNLRCQTCLQFRGMKEQNRDLSFKEIKEIADQIPVLKRAVLHGIGEPLLNKELTEIINYLKERKVHVLFNTNALLLDKKWAKDFVSSGLDELRISLDAATESTYTRVRGSDNFPKVINNVETLSRMRNAAHPSTPKVSVWMVATRENVEDLPEMIKLAARVGIDEVYLQRLVYPTDGHGRGLAVKEKAITYPSSRVVEILRKSSALSKRLRVSLMASGLVSPNDSLMLKPRGGAPWRQCRRPWEVAYVTARGNVLPCCISPFSTLDYASLILGNVFKQSFDEVWRGEKYRDFRRKHQSLYPPACCTGCGVEWSL
jgi:MoaA/NifB/PqqE/SkfB family radical SAM enzyme